MNNIIWKRGIRPIKSEKKNYINPIDIALSETIDKDMINKYKFKDKLNNKLNDRFMIKQINNNPFFANSYLDDLNTQDKFLIPQSSNNNL